MEKLFIQLNESISTGEKKFLLSYAELQKDCKIKLSEIDDAINYLLSTGVISHRRELKTHFMIYA